MRRRNPRTLRAYLLTVALTSSLSSCSSSFGPVVRDEQAPIQTDALSYQLLPDWIGLGVDVPYVYTNPTGMTVYLDNCQGAFFVDLERLDPRGWRDAWDRPIPLCLSAPIVIPAHGQFVDTLRIWGAPPESNTAPSFDRKDPSGVYRIVWQAGSFRPNGGLDIPVEARVSNRFVLTK